MRRLLAAALVAWGCAHGEGSAPVRVAPHSGSPAPVRVAPPNPVATPAEPSIAQLLAEARGLMARAEWEGARQRFDAVLAKEPRDAEVLFEAGFVAEQGGRNAEARELYRRAAESDAGHVGAAVNLARLLVEEEPAQAEKVLRGALARRDGEPLLLDALASVLVREGKLDEAADAARRVLSRDPRHVAAQKTLAQIEARRGHLRLAESLLQSARKVDAMDPAIPHALGLIAAEREEVAAARAWFEQATRIDAAFVPAWTNLGALALRYRDYRSADQAYSRAVRIDPSRWESHLGRAWALEGLKKPKDALAEYENVLALRPGQDDASYGRAVALRADGELDAALRAFQEYAAKRGVAHLKEAQRQIAAIELRLKAAPAKADAAPAIRIPETSIVPRSESGQPAHAQPQEANDAGIAAAH